MKADIIVNEYALVWYMLFQSDVNESLSKLKERLWQTYKEQYNNN